MVSVSKFLIDGSLVPKKQGTRERKDIKKLLCQYQRVCENTWDGGRVMREDRRHLANKTPVIGSKEQVITAGDHGFFSAVMEAYNNHWALETCPEDWLYTIVQKIARHVDDNSKAQEVRAFFLGTDRTNSSEGKKILTVQVPEDNPLLVDYSWFIDQMTAQIRGNIEVPGYVDLLTPDFSTSTPTQQLVSGITVMMSLQEYFEYHMMCGCGIPEVNLQGKLEDWENLKRKILSLKQLLSPIHKNLGLEESWWKGLEEICDNLILTYQGTVDPSWWFGIIGKSKKTMTWFGGSGMKMTGEKLLYDGWFITQLLGLPPIEGDFKEIKSGLVAVPMTISHPFHPTEKATFIAGMTGFNVENVPQSKWPRVSSVHGWCLCLSPESPYRPQMDKMEQRFMAGA